MQREGETPSKTARLMRDSVTLVKLRHLSRKTVKDVAMHITSDSSVWSDAMVKIGEEVYNPKAPPSFRRCLLFLLYEVWVLVKHDQERCAKLVSLIHWVGPFAVASLEEADAPIVRKVVNAWDSEGIVSADMIACWASGSDLPPWPQQQRLPILLEGVDVIHGMRRSQSVYLDAIRWRAAQLLRTVEAHFPHIFEEFADSAVTVAIVNLASKWEGQRLTSEGILKWITARVLAPRRLVPSTNVHSLASVLKVERSLLFSFGFDCPTSPMEVFHQLFPLRTNTHDDRDQRPLTSSDVIADAAKHWCPPTTHECRARRLLAQQRCLAKQEVFEIEPHVIAAAAVLLSIAASDAARDRPPGVRRSPSSVSVSTTPVDAYTVQEERGVAPCCLGHMSLEQAVQRMFTDPDRLRSAIDMGFLRALELIAQGDEHLHPAARAVASEVRELLDDKRFQRRAKRERERRRSRSREPRPAPKDLWYRRRHVVGPNGDFEPYPDGDYIVQCVLRLSGFVTHPESFPYSSSSGRRLKSAISVVEPEERSSDRRVRQRVQASEN